MQEQDGRAIADFRTGDFTRLGSGGPGMRWIAVAPDLLDGVS